MSAESSAGLASIIVPCWNQRGFTELCFQALFRHTRPAWELIVVNNGSTDDTPAYLAGVRDAAPVAVTIIANRENLGFPRAINQGLEAASGEYLVLLNNDAVVTDGWLDQLIALTLVEMGGAGGGPAAMEASRETCGRAEGVVGRPAPGAAGGIDRRPAEAGTPAGNGESAGWSSGFSRSSDMSRETYGRAEGVVGRPAPGAAGGIDRRPPEGGTPAGNGKSEGWSSGFSRSSDMSRETYGRAEGVVGRPAPAPRGGSIEDRLKAELQRGMANRRAGVPASAGPRFGGRRPRPSAWSGRCRTMSRRPSASRT